MSQIIGTKMTLIESILGANYSLGDSDEKIEILSQTTITIVELVANGRRKRLTSGRQLLSPATGIYLMTGGLILSPTTGLVPKQWQAVRPTLHW